MHSINNPVSVYIGENAISQLESILNDRKYLIISSAGYDTRGWKKYFKNPKHIIDSVSANPTIAELSTHIKILREIDCDVIIGIGGGSVIDTTKVLSVLSKVSENNFLDYLHGVKDCPPKDFELIAIPTTAGTGAEITPFATVWDDINNNKLSLFSSFIYPNHAIIDPQLALTLDSEMTAISALDALSHSFESLWNKNSNTYTISLALTAINTILDNLPLLLKDLNNLDLRLKMSWSSYLAGICISSTKTAIAHSISYPLTSYLKIPHGLASGIFLPEILSFNTQNDRSGTLDAIFKKLYKEIPIKERLFLLYQELYKRNLFKNIINNKSTLYSLIPKMINPSRSLNNLISVTEKDIKTILDAFYGNY